MAPTTPLVLEWQTNQIIKYLLEDDDDNQYRKLDCELEVDSPAAAANSDDSFDPVLIADKLRSVADSLNDDVQFGAVLREMKRAAAKEAIDAAFSQGVQAIYQNQVSKQAEVASEMQLVRVAVAVGLYIKKSSPELKDNVRSAMSEFLNRRINPWVNQQGGWDKVI